LQANWERETDDVKVNRAVVEATRPDGPDVIVVCGAAARAAKPAVTNVRAVSPTVAVTNTRVHLPITPSTSV
jgi:hypothetical protein